MKTVFKQVVAVLVAVKALFIAMGEADPRHQMSDDNIWTAIAVVLLMVSLVVAVAVR